MVLAVETKGLKRTFGDLVAVDGIDLAVPAGSFYGFLGPNGAGKSTTIKCLTGLLRPSGGEMRLLGIDPLADPVAVKRKTGVMPEDLALFERLTGAETLSFVGQVHGLEKATIRTAPRLLFLDEPFEGIDAVASRQIKDLLSGFVRGGGTIFLTSHILEIVERLSDHIGVIHKGRLVAQGRVDDLRAGSAGGGQTLEEIFLGLVGASDQHGPALEWLSG